MAVTFKLNLCGKEMIQGAKLYFARRDSVLKPFKRKWCIVIITDKAFTLSRPHVLVADSSGLCFVHVVTEHGSSISAVLFL